MLCIPVATKGSISVVNLAITVQDKDGPLQLHVFDSTLILLILERIWLYYMSYVGIQKQFNF